MAQILPRDLPPVPGGVVNPAAANIIDDGAGVWQATPAQIADAGAPINSQAAAEAGLINTGRMTPLRTKQAIDALGVSQAVLATAAGSEGVGFLQTGTDAVLRSISDKLLGYVDVLDFIPVNLHAAIRNMTSSADVTVYIQKAIDSLQTLGGTVYIPAGKYYTTDTLTMRSGVSLRGAGRHINFSGGTNLFGTWIDYHGDTTDPCLSFYNCQAIVFSGIGILCVEASNQTAIFIGSDNDPAAKALTFLDFMVIAADVGVRWGNANADNPIEQCDDMTFDRGWFISCGDAIIIDAANAADFSKVERCSFYNVKRSAVHMKKSAFIRFADCAAGLLFSTSEMFKFEGNGPDPIIISLCQSESGDGKFLTYNPASANDQGQVILDGNVINQAVEVNGISRVISRGNFINSTISLTGFVRWKSEDDVYDGVHGQPTYAQQVFVDGSVQFSAHALKNATQQRGFHLPNNYRVENGSATAGGYTGMVNTRAGIYAYPYAELAGASFPVGYTVVPTVDNGHAYIVDANVGAIGAEPTWPTGAGATVTSGGVTFKEIGAAALLKGYGAIAA